MTDSVQIPRDVLQATIDALDKLSKLGNGDHVGNSVGNEVAHAALLPLLVIQAMQPVPKLRVQNQFNHGDRVRYIDEDNASLRKGKEYVVLGLKPFLEDGPGIILHGHQYGSWYESSFELVTAL